MHAILKVNGENTSLDSFVCPDMSLSSARTNMVKHNFTLSIKAEELIKEMNTDYEDWVAESKADDDICGGPQDELAKAGYPPIDDLIKIPNLLVLTFGHYLIKELFDKVLPSMTSRMLFWFDKIIGCELNNTDVLLKGVCYSRSKT